jgi:RES domain-containing protein
LTVASWRIGIDTPDYEADSLSGKGAEKKGGRWNRAGSAVVYSAGSIALSCLETVVHLNADEGLPFNRFLVKIDIPDAIWEGRVHLSAADLPVGWESIPTGKASLDVGDAWLRSMQSAVMTIPSVLVPEEYNVLLNAAHPDAKKVSARKVRRWLYDGRLLRRDS